jgi:hypothetical protein
MTLCELQNYLLQIRHREETQQGRRLRRPQGQCPPAIQDDRQTERDKSLRQKEDRQRDDRRRMAEHSTPRSRRTKEMTQGALIRYTPSRMPYRPDESRRLFECVLRRLRRETLEKDERFQLGHAGFLTVRNRRLGLVVIFGASKGLRERLNKLAHRPTSCFLMLRFSRTAL